MKNHILYKTFYKSWHIYNTTEVKYWVINNIPQEVEDIESHVKPSLYLIPILYIKSNIM